MKKILLAAAALLSLISCHRTTPQTEVHRIMTDRMVTLSTAESCTGGIIASRFTALPGASAYFKCGLVCYSNDAKRTMLGVSADSIGRYGAVSEQVVRLMAEGARRIGNADYGIATTGIAGPSGGTPEIPVGTVWLAVSTPRHTIARQIHARGDRSEVVDQASTEVIEMLLEELQNNK